MLKSFVALVMIIFVNFSALSETIKVAGASSVNSLPQNLLKVLANRAGFEIAYPQERIASSAITVAKTQNDIESGALDVMWTATSAEIEQNYQALYYPLYKGMLGMRIGVIRKDQTNLFSGVKTLQDLQKFRAGSGKGWADTNILEENNLNVVETMKYPNLFYMLEGGRFDYFPRAIHEPWREIENNKALNLTVEPNILINYKLPMYFFIKKGNVALANRLSAAIEEIITDGTFDEMFFSDPEVKSAIEKSDVANRHIIELNNPFLSEKTPISRKELWFDPRAGES